MTSESPTHLVPRIDTGACASGTIRKAVSKEDLIRNNSDVWFGRKRPMAYMTLVPGYIQLKIHVDMTYVYDGAIGHLHDRHQATTLSSNADFTVHFPYANLKYFQKLNPLLHKGFRRQYRILENHSDSRA